MPLSEPPDTTLPSGRCPRCARVVLTHVEFAGDGAIVRRCVHCDHGIDATQPVSAAQLDMLGYVILEDRHDACGTGHCATSACGTRRPS